MDNDPPPSYKSVVEGETRQRSQCRISEGQTEPRKQSETSDANSPRESRSGDGEEPEQRPAGLWARLKKSLEDFALFVIQVLDWNLLSQLLNLVIFLVISILIKHSHTL